jgi:ankyrin repeat protein
MPQCAAVLVKQRADVAFAKASGWTALMAACQAGHDECATVLLDVGADGGQQKRDGWTPMLVSCKGGHADCVDALLERGISLNRPKDDGWTPLMVVRAPDGRCHCLPTLRLTLDGAADAATKRMRAACVVRVCCVSQAARNGHDELVASLLERLAEVGAKKPNGFTSLMASAQGGHVRVAELLIDASAAVSDTRTDDGWTSLMLSCQNGHEQVAALLIDRRADVHQSLASGWTALMAAAQNGRVPLVELLHADTARTPRRRTYAPTARDERREM